MAAAVHVLCGPARAGKTRRMLERYRARLADAPGSALWLGPTVRAVEALRERLLQETAASCFRGCTPFKRCCRKSSGSTTRRRGR